MTNRQIVNNLKKCGWRPSSVKRHKDVWLPPIPNRFGKYVNTGVTMLRAAELCGLKPWLASNLNSQQSTT